jgi:hypothetical protein
VEVRVLSTAPRLPNLFVSQPTRSRGSKQNGQTWVRPPSICAIPRCAESAIRVAALALRAQVVTGRAGAAVEHRMAVAAGTAPHARPASFRDLCDQAVGFAHRRGHHGGAGGRCDADCQCGAQDDRLHHVAAFSRVEAKPNLTPGPESARVRPYQPRRQNYGRRRNGRVQRGLSDRERQWRAGCLRRWSRPGKI